MVVMKVPTLSEIDVNKITFSDVKSLDMGAKMINIYYDDHPFVFKLPTLKIPFGMSDYKGNNKWSIDLTLSNENNEIKDKIKEIEKYIINAASKNSVKWLGSTEVDPEVVEELFTSGIKYSIDKKTNEIDNRYPGRLKIQVPYANKRFNCKAYNAAKEYIEITPDIMCKGTNISSVVHCSGVWIAGGKLGYTLKAQQIKIDEKESTSSYRFDEYAFVEDPDDNEYMNEDDS